MKVVYVLVLAMLTLGLGAVAIADQLPANDPQIKTGGPLAASSSFSALALAMSAPASIVFSSFTIESPSGTSPATSSCILMEGGSITSPNCFFENDITTNGVGDTITKLTFKFGADSIVGMVMCSELPGSPFSDCSVSEVSGVYTVDFTDGSIPYASTFTLDFAGFPAHFNFPTKATVPVIPEPGTLALLLTGAGALWARRRSRGRS
jgi:hypothetical protein